jgi:pyruvate,orthophosphate dikinase
MGRETAVFRRVICWFVSMAFFCQSFPVSAAEMSWLPAPGTIVALSPQAVPVLLQGIKVDPAHPLQFKFLFEDGKEAANTAEIQRNLRYFLTGLTVAEKDIWVNLSPNDKDRIVPDVLSRTETGRDLLGLDYYLKQLSSSLLYPEGASGREFWQKVYARVGKELGTLDIPLDIHSRVWIAPGEIRVSEEKGIAVIRRATFKVLIEEDYLSAKNRVAAVSDQAAHARIMKDVFRLVIIPALEQEVNSGVSFGRLRQIYHALILAAWYKRRFHDGTLARDYVNRGRIAGLVTEDRALRTRIFERYVQAYDQGAFSLIKEDNGVGEVIPKKYFSGGVTIGPDMEKAFQTEPLGADFAQFSGNLRLIDVEGVDRAQSAEQYLVTDQRQIGNKGRNLQKIQAVLPEVMPPFQAVSGQLYDDIRSGKADLTEVAHLLYVKFEDLINAGGSIAVRPAGAINMPGMMPTIKKVRTEAEIISAFRSIYESWESSEVQAYLKTEAGQADLMALKERKFPGDIGPAVIVQQEVFSDRGDESASGVFVSRDMSSGDFRLSGSVGLNMPPEDIRNGVSQKLRTLSPAVNKEFWSYMKDGSRFDLTNRFVAENTQQAKGDKVGIYEVLESAALMLEDSFQFPVEVEFVIDHGKIYIVQVNEQDVSPAVQKHFLDDKVKAGVLSRTGTVRRRQGGALVVKEGRLIDGARTEEVASSQEAFSPGSVEGRLAFDVDMARKMRAQGEKVVLVSTEFDQPGFVQGLVDREFDGLVTLYGSYHMHYARIARGRGIPGVSLAGEDVSVIKGDAVPALRIGTRMLNQGERVVIAAQDTTVGDEVVHAARIFVPQQDTPVVEYTETVSTNADFDVDAIYRQIRSAYGKTDTVVLTALHAFMKMYLQTQVTDNDVEADKLEIATNEMHKILEDFFHGEGVDQTRLAEFDGSRESVFLPIAQGFRDNFPFPEIKNIEDITKALDLMKEMVKRYQGMKPREIQYLNYTSGKRNKVAEARKVPVGFSIIFDQPVNWWYENPELWAYVRGFKAQVVFPLQDMPSKRTPGPFLGNVRVNPDNLNDSQLRVEGFAENLFGDQPSRLINVQVTEKNVKLPGGGVTILTLPQESFLLEVAGFNAYFEHRIHDAREKYAPNTAGNAKPFFASKKAALDFLKSHLNPGWSQQSTLRWLQEKGFIPEIESDGFPGDGVSLLEGDLVFRFFRQHLGSYVSGDEHRDGYIADRDQFWARESRLLVKLIKSLTGENGAIHRSIQSKEAGLEAHNQFSVWDVNYFSWIKMESRMVDALAAELSRLSKKYDLSGMVKTGGRLDEIDLEGVLILSYLDRNGDSQGLLAMDQADSSETVGGIDLDISAFDFGGDPAYLVPAMNSAIDGKMIHGLTPVITAERSVASVMDFVRP